MRYKEKIRRIRSEILDAALKFYELSDKEAEDIFVICRKTFFNTKRATKEGASNE